MDRIRLGFAFCGSFCTLSKAVAKLRSAVEAGYDVYPIMSFNAYATDTRFGKADDFVWEIEDLCGRKVIKSIVDAEPLGPKKMVDVLLIAPWALPLRRSQWRQSPFCGWESRWCLRRQQTTRWPLPRRISAA